MEKLINVVQPYAWGSKELLAGLMGRPPAEAPEAELWMGAHPVAPSRVGTRSLLELIEAEPAQLLGPAVVERYGAKLPFLLKLLAAGQPLSLQAHPSLEQARAGFARENAAGVPLTAANRNYKDPNHKPELLCALTPFRALCGFRAVAQTAELFEALKLSELAKKVSEGLHPAFAWVMDRPKSDPLIEAVVTACRAHQGKWKRECQTAVGLDRLYPGDVGVVSALLLNLLELQPGEAIYLPAGNLHAYLGGLGVEVMANSDNVLRGGLTPKHVDVAELLQVLDFHDGPVGIVRPVEEGPEQVYLTPAPEFRLSRFVLQGHSVQPARRGAELLVCTGGEVTAGVQVLPAGASVFIPASDGLYALSGRGTVYRATVNG